ncbi:response regulator [Falsirhodobacter algicola]|uniref:histidine kinase n=1 Tax=Falsirhodobacter algicola TaxID=2692330 RepID=A0A8J8MTI9_9RHOB|nr:response regulator [Falsirhodobacter algicola]QUS36219.1 response regulator [Falsirhodobacter algicola]
MNTTREFGLYALLGALIAGVFAVDLMVPLGIAIWVIYLLPVVLAYLAPRPVVPPLTAVVVFVTMVIGLLNARAGIDPTLAATNRAMAIVVILLLGLSGFTFVRNRIALRQQSWLQQGDMEVSRASEGEVDLAVMADNVLAALADRLGARAAIFYVRDGGEFRQVAGRGLPPGETPRAFRSGESHLWDAVEKRTVLTLDRLPGEALAFGSGLVRGRTAQSVIAPLYDDRRINGVVEFGFDTPVRPEGKLLLERVGAAIGIAVRSANDRTRLRALLEETRHQAEELKAHGEELAASNEELAEQTRALQDSQSRLEHQQAELEEQNALLETQTQELEVQRDALARSQSLMEQQAQRLATESRYKSEFVANMSHELRTPLNALLIMARLLAENRGATLTEEQVGWAETIESSGRDLLALINDILDLAKIEAGKLDVTPEIVRPEDVARKLERSFAPQAQGKGLTFRVEVPTNIPDLQTDPARLEQVLRNFLSNAIKFTERGSVTLSAHRDGDGVAFAVRDTGIGIAREDQEAVFEAFRQADGTIARRFGGTGLGLSISRELTELLKGRVSLQSDLGKGTTFTLHLPARLGDAAPRPALPAAAPPPPAPIPAAAPPAADVSDDREVLDGDKRLILVVEDDPAFARILIDLAHELGFQCLVTGTAEDGVLAARQYMPSAIVLDVGLPDHSGLSVLDRLKRDIRTRHIPVHMVSGDDYTREALAQGARSYMLKPVKREALAQALHSIETRLDQRMRRVLIVEDDPAQLEGLKALLGNKDVETVGAATAAEARERMAGGTFDCMVLDMTLPDASGFDLLEALDSDEEAAFPPVIVYTARALSEAEELRLRRYSKSIIIKGAKSPERLIDEVTLFLHQVVTDLPERQQQLLAASLNRDAMLEGKRILVVEDDIRNVYALTAVFEPHGAEVKIARNGREALEALGRVADSGAPGVDLVLMDVMMPEMDGLTATREIRAQERWKNLPIIMLTAKAMADDQEQCLAAGANDYLPKPLDVDRLLSLTRVWMRR